GNFKGIGKSLQHLLLGCRLNGSFGSRLRFGLGLRLFKRIHGAACLLDLFKGRFRERMRADLERMLEFAVAENLDRKSGLADELFLAQQVRRNLDGRAELAQAFQRNDFVFRFGRERETALGNAADERRLAAFETLTDAARSARPRALVPAARGLAV